MRVLTVLSLLVFVAACNSSPAPTTPAAPAAAAPQVKGSLNQVMRGILFPNSNILFDAQDKDPAAKPDPKDPAAAAHPFAGTYGGWEAVENSGMALAESANLLIIPRTCANGKPAPIQNADWKMWVQELRDAGLEVYKAGQAKNEEVVLQAADALGTACLHCHAKYRNVPGGMPNRC